MLLKTLKNGTARLYVSDYAGKHLIGKFKTPALAKRYAWNLGFAVKKLK